MKYCVKCGAQLDDEAVICPKCGCYADGRKYRYPDEEKVIDPNASKLSRGIDAILCLVLGGIGAHCFYEGKTGKGIAYIFTFGLFGIGVLVDLIKIVAGNQKDKEGKPISNWDLD